MRILVREMKDGELKYVWKRINILNSLGRHLYNDHFVVGDKEYSSTEIMDVMNDTRKKYVWCSSCGKTIRNNPSAINEHIQEMRLQANCTKCQQSSIRHTSGTKTKIKYTDGNKVLVKEEYEGELFCNASFRFRTPEQAQEKGSCIYYRCNADEMRHFDGNTSIWLRYPHMFDKLATETKLIKNGWRCTENTDTWREFKYKTYSLHAYTDLNGIIQYFKVKCGDSEAIIRYSHKYDKFIHGNSEYEFPRWLWSEDKRNTFMQTIRELYN